MISIFNFLSILIIHVYMCLLVCRSEEGIGYPGTGNTTGGLWTTCFGCWELNLFPSQEHQVLLTRVISTALIFIFNFVCLCVSEGCLYTSACALCDQKRALVFLELLFQVAVSCSAWVGELNLGSLREQYLLLTVGPFLQPTFLLFPQGSLF